MPCLKRFLSILGIAGAYYLAAILGLQLALPLANATAVWASSGIALAALLLGGARLWPGVMLGAFLANAHVLWLAGTGGSGAVLFAAAVIAAGNTLEAILGSFLFRCYIARSDPLRYSRDPLILFLVAAISCGVAAFIGVATVVTMGFTPWQIAGSALLTWWLGDLAGILIVTPLVLVFGPMSNWRIGLRSIILHGAFLIGLAFAAILLFAGGVSQDLAASMAYLILPLVLIAALWGGPALTQLSVAIIAAIAIYGAIHRHGPFVQPSLYSSLLLTQTFICVLALAGGTLTAAITERKLREKTLHRTYRELQVLTRCNAAVVQATDEMALLRQVCQVAVDAAGYRLAWVGYAESDEGRTVRPVAWAGPAFKLVDNLYVSWGNNAHGHGAVGEAIRTGSVKIVDDVLHHPDYAVWQDRLSEHSFRSVAAIPLQAQGIRYGAIAFYSSDPYGFSASEQTFLAELGPNVSRGILTLRTQKQQEQMRNEMARRNHELATLATDNANLYLQVQRHATELELRVQERTAQLQQQIMERDAAQISLRESECKYRQLVEQVNSIILRMDPQGRITFINQFGQRFFGYREDELLGRSIIGTIVPQSESGGRDLAQLMIQTASHPEHHTSNENENIRRDGTRAWISWTNRPIYDGNGQLMECLSVGNDITGLKSAEAALAEAKEAAESADRLKSVFLATMSHELRTPLNSIIGFTGILLQELPGPLNSEQRNQLGMVRSAARHLLALITDVLDISKIEAGQLTIQRVPFSLSAAIQKVVETITPLAQSKHLEIVSDVAPDMREFHGDQRRVEQILLNLMSNAVKFTEHGHIALRCAQGCGEVVISVQDTGCGIADQDRATLFRPFRQLDTGLSRQHEGTGLGLAICKRLVEIMGGRIELASQVGQGSTFTVRLPELS